MHLIGRQPVPSVLTDLWETMRERPWNLADDYRTVPVCDFLTSESATCWDFVNFQHDRLFRAGVPDGSYLALYETGDGDPLSHTWTVAYVGGQLWWFERSWGDHEGIVPVGSWRDVLDEVVDANPPIGEVSVYRYDPTGLDLRLDPDSFVRSVVNRGERLDWSPLD